MSCHQCGNQTNNAKYCSLACVGAAKRTRASSQCLACGQSTSNPKFCNRSCAAIYNNSAAPKRKRTAGRYDCLNCGSVLSGQNASTYCSNACQQAYRSQRLVADWLEGRHNPVGPSGSLKSYARRYLGGLHGDKCSQCGWAEVHPVTGKVPVQVDHIDGDFLNNRIENLRLLCPNCHSLTETYGFLNAGRGRTARGTRHRKP